MNLTSRHCSACGEERVFEQPPCEDGHGADCPEWVCLECGSAILVGFGPDIGVPADAPSRAA